MTMAHKTMMGMTVMGRAALLAALLAGTAQAADAAARQPASTVSLFDACAPEKSGYSPIAKRGAHAVLFRIERCGQPESYVLGSIHSDDAGARHQVTPVFALLPNLAAAGFEYLEPEDAEEVVARTMFDPRPDARLSDHLTEPLWHRLRERLAARRGMPENAIQRLKPWAAAVMLQVPEPRKRGQILDDLLKDQVKAQDVRLFGLETMQEQLAIFDGMPEERQWTMLKDTLAGLSAIDLTNTKLTQAYASGDLAEIERLGEQGFAEIKDESLRRYLQESLITKRNARMAERMQLELTGEPVLTVVGALHLPGKDGILQRMERAGYYLFPIEGPPNVPTKRLTNPVIQPSAASVKAGAAAPAQGH